MAYPTLPALNGFSIHKRPTFHTTLITPRSGREVTKYNQTLPNWEFELVYEVLRDETQNSTPVAYFAGQTEFQQIAGLFAACAGEFGFFYFEDLSDNSRVQQPLATADGSETAFRLLRTISYGGVEYTEPVGAINLDESIVVYVDDVAVPQPGNWTISDDLMFLVFDSPPGSSSTIKITFYYKYLCRFIMNEVEFEQFMYNRWAQGGLRFRSVLLWGTGEGVSNPIITDPLIPPIEPTPIPLPPGTYYWEVTLDVGGLGYAAWGIAFGIGNASLELTNTGDAAVNLAQLNSQYSDLQVVCTDPGQSGGGTFGYPDRPEAASIKNAAANGQVYAVSVDSVNHKLWWRSLTGFDTRWNGALNGNPVTGTGYIDITASGDSPVLGNIFAVVGATVGRAIFVGPYDSPSQGTANFGSSAFAGTPPSGYISPASVYLGTPAFDPGANGGVTLTNGNLTMTGERNPPNFPFGIPYNCCRSNFSIEQA